MSERTSYIVDFGYLKPGQYEYGFDLDDTFFGEGLNAFAKQCNSHTSVVLDKGSTNIMDFTFSIAGNAVLTCDRCLDEFSYRLSSSHSIIVKLEDGEESNDEIVYLPASSHEIDLRQYIYEFHLLSIPIKKTCQLASKECNEDITSRLNNSENTEGEQTDPRWDILKNLQ